MDSADALEASLAEIEFLARSPNRVRVLAALTDGPIDRYDLEETTGVARATLGRILDDFAERGWIVEDDRRYETSQVGAYVSRELTAVLSRFEPVPALNEVAQWLPEEWFDFDLGRLAGAEFVHTTKRDPLAPTAHISRRIQGADRVRLITYSVLPDVMEACWRGILDEGLELDGVLDDGALSGFGTHPQMVEQAREMAETGRSEVYVFHGDIPSTVFVVDDAVLLCLAGGEGAPMAVIESDDEAVRAWAESTIDDHRSEGDRLDPSVFTG